VYPGEIDAQRFDAVIKRDIRARIAECECLIVIISATTHLRRSVDYEIRTEFEEKLPGGPRPVVGLLTPELFAVAAEIHAEIEAVRSTFLWRGTGKVVQELSDRGWWHKCVLRASMACPRASWITS